MCLQFALAPWRASRRRVDRVDVLGIAQYLTWKSNEVVVVERGGKAMSDLLKKDIDDNRGGARFIYTLFGESVRARVWFGVQLWTWEDRLSTSDGIPCSLRVFVKLAVRSDDVLTYVYKNKSSKHLNESGEVDALGMAEEWLKSTTHDAVSSILSNEHLIRMIILRLPNHRSNDQVTNAAEVIESSVTEISRRLVKVLQTRLSERAQAHGMRVDEIEVPSLKFAPEVVKKALDTFLMTFEPLQAMQLAEAARITANTQTEVYADELRAKADVLGLSVTQLIELLKHSGGLPRKLVPVIASAVENQNLKPGSKFEDQPSLESEAKGRPPE